MIDEMITEREMVAALVAAWEPLVQHFAGIVAERVTTKVQAEIEPPQPRYYTRQETAALLHITLPTLARLTDDGHLEAHRAGRRVLYRADKIDEMVNSGAKLKYLRRA